MSYLTGLQCTRCKTQYPAGPMFEGCPKCANDKKPANVLPTYDYASLQKSTSRASLNDRHTSMWRYREWLPVNDPKHIVSLSEGWTPLIAVPRLGAQLGLYQLFVKDESRSSTWSFKDRLSSAAVSKGVEMGAKVITITSSGNGGAAAAAYAARAGLDCVVFTTSQFPLTMRTQMQVYGAKVIAMPTNQDRWTMVKMGVDRFDWWPIQNYMEPQVGANPYGIDGFKTMAFEIIEQMDWEVPDWVSVPTAVGDAMVGLWRGFREWHNAGWVSKVPQMLAAEVFGPLKAALERDLDHVETVPGHPTVAMSAGGRSSGFQALQVLRESEGAATDASEGEILEMQKNLATLEGIFAEPSSVLPLIGLHKLRQAGTIAPNDRVVAILSATGLKDPESPQTYLPKIPHIQPTYPELVRALEETYHFHISE